MIDVYVYGMTVLSTIHRLKGPFPQADTYQEITQTTVMPGGEGGNAAILLSHWGLKTQLDGCMFSEATAGPLLAYFDRYGVDCSLLPTVPDFTGWRDIVFCDGESRTVFGWFQQHFSGERHWWTEPCEASIAAARCVALDPFFGATSQRVAELCVQHGTDYVTLDARWDDALAQNARAIACSKEFLESAYPGADYAALLDQYRRTCRGLVIFTFGSKEMLYHFTGDGTPGDATHLPRDRAGHARRRRHLPRGRRLRRRQGDVRRGHRPLRRRRRRRRLHALPLHPRTAEPGRNHGVDKETVTAKNENLG